MASNAAKAPKPGSTQQRPIGYRECLLILLTFFTSTHATITGPENVLTAYDCAKPLAVEDRALHQEELDCRMQHEVAREKKKEFQLLALEPIQTLEGYRCEIQDTKTMSYCGNYDHQTLLNKYNYYKKHMPPSISDCARMWNHKEYVTPKGESISLGIGINNFNYQSVGNTWIDDKEAHCLGESTKLKGTSVDEIIEDHAIELTLSKETFKYGGGKLAAVTGDEILSCGVYAEQCETPRATYLWKPAEEEFCPLAFSKIVSGALTTAEDDRQVFMSNDGSLVRLVLTYEVAHCGNMVWATNYDNLFLAEVGQGKPFTRPLDPTSTISLSTYIRNRDDFLYSYTIEQLNIELNAVLQHDCEENYRRARMEYFYKHQHPGVVTYAYGNGTFAVSAGEVMYYYKCPAVRVKAIELEQCFDALPVKILPPHRDDGPDPSHLWFLEPLTHQLTRIASATPCVKAFPPKYQLDSRKWLSVDPQIRAAPRPKPAQTTRAVEHSLEREIDPSKGGIYDEEELKKLETYISMPHARKAIGNALGNQVRNFNPTENHLTPNQMFPFQTPSSWFKDFTAKVVRFLEIWGEGAAITFSLFFFLRLISNVIHWIFAGKQLHAARGCGVGLLWMLCPTMFLLKQFAGASVDGAFTMHSPAGDRNNGTPESYSMSMLNRARGSRRRRNEDSGGSGFEPRPPGGVNENPDQGNEETNNETTYRPNPC